MHRFNGWVMGGMACMVAAAAMGCANQEAAMSRECTEPAKVQRFGSVIGIRKENIEEYKRLHAAAWPGVLAKIRECNIRNYSIFLAEVRPDEYYLFSYFEYVGDDLAKEIEEKMKTDETTRKWWSYTDPLQEPVPTRREGEWWHTIEEVFHTD